MIYNLFMYIFLLNAYKSSLGSTRALHHRRMNKIQSSNKNKKPHTNTHIRNKIVMLRAPSSLLSPPVYTSYLCSDVVFAFGDHRIIICLYILYLYHGTTVRRCNCWRFMGFACVSPFAIVAISCMFLYLIYACLIV